MCRPLPHCYQTFVHISEYIVLVSLDRFTNVCMHAGEHAKVLMKFKSYSMKSWSLNCQALGFTQHKSRSTILIIFIVIVLVCLHKKSYHREFCIRNILVLQTKLKINNKLCRNWWYQKKNLVSFHSSPWFGMTRISGVMVSFSFLPDTEECPWGLL